MSKSLLLQVACDPSALRAGQQGIHAWLIRAERTVIEVRRIMQMCALPCVQLDVKHLLRDGTPVAVLQQARILDGVLHVKQDSRHGAGIALVHKDGTAAKQIAVTVEREVERSIKERMSWADESCKGLSLRRNQVLLERNALVARLDSFPVPISRSRLRIVAGTWVTS